MFDEILEKIKQIMASRLIPISIVLVVLFSILISRLFKFKLLKKRNAYPFARDKNRVYSPIKSLIRASNGEILADNKLVYTVELYDVLSSKKKK